MTFPTPSGVDVASISSALLHWQISEAYFSDILQSQLIIFSAITAGIVGFAGFLFDRINKNTIKSVTAEEAKSMRQEFSDLIRAKLNEFTQSQDGRFRTLEDTIGNQIKEHKDKNQSTFENHEVALEALRTEIYRAVGNSYNSQNEFPLAFLWFMRSANSSRIADDKAGDKEGKDGITRLLMGQALTALESITDRGLILSNTNIMQETQKILPGLDLPAYKAEHDLIQTTFNRKIEAPPRTEEPKTK